MRAYLVSILACMLAHQLSAQYQLGAALGNYAGTDAIILNPARGATQWPYADVRMLGADMYAWNDLASVTLRDRSLAGEVRNGFKGGVLGDVAARELLSPRDKKATVQVGMSGPGASMVLGRGALAFGIRSRAMVGISDVADPLGRHIYHGLGFAEQRSVQLDLAGPRMISAAWTEASLSYAHLVMARDFNLLSFGATLRYMAGHAAAVMNLNELSYTSTDASGLEVHGISGSYGVAMPDPFAGSGVGGDIGMVYERTVDEADGYMPHRSGRGCTPLAYQYRIGLSLLDLGGMHFAGAKAGAFDQGALSLANYNRTGVNDMADLDSLLGTVAGHRSHTGMWVGAPTAFAVQYDQRLAHQVYVAFAGVQQLSFPDGTRLRAANVMAFVPRLETRYVELAMPVSVREYDLRRPGVGASLRLNGITIGSDDLLPLFGRRDIRSVDVHFRVKWLIHRSPFCRGRRPGSERRAPGSPGALPCVTPGSRGR
jgi:hypothetical protein